MRKMGVFLGLMLLLNLLSLSVIVTAEDEYDFQDLKFAVTPEGWDNIGYILEKLGYSYDIILFDELLNLTYVSAYDVIFINCASDVDYYFQLHGDEAGPVLNSYVEAGGIIYASDWAYRVIEETFDDAIKFYGEEIEDNLCKIGQACNVSADVVDPGFAAYLGDNIVTVEFNMDAWVVMESVPETTKQYLSGVVEISGEGPMDVPITVSFSRGEGYVIFTSFHYEAQGPMAETLMEYLVFKAVTEDITSTVESSLTGEGYDIAYDIRGGINQDETKDYNIEIDESGDTKFVLDCYGDYLEFIVQMPDGSNISGEGAKQKYVEISDASAGTYTVSITGFNVSNENEPFTILIGTVAGSSDDDNGSEPTSTSPDTPGFELLTMMVAIVIALILLKKKK